MSHHLPQDQWQDWVNQICAELGVDAGDVDITQILALTKVVAHRFERPMAPVSAYLLGLAVGQGRGPAAALSDQIVASLPTTNP